MSLVEDLKTPEDFKGNPYGYLTNQIGHIYLGFTLVSWHVWVIDKFSSFPEQTLSVLVVSLLYLICWELLIQGWRGWDTIKDSSYFFLGTLPYLFIDFITVIDRVGFFLLLSWCLLLIDSSRK